MQKHQSFPESSSTSPPVRPHFCVHLISLVLRMLYRETQSQVVHLVSLTQARSSPFFCAVSRATWLFFMAVHSPQDWFVLTPSPASLVAQIVKNLAEMQETWVRSLCWEDPLKKGMATHCTIFLLGESRGQRSLVGCSPWGHKESDTTEWLTHTPTHILFIGGFPGGSVVKHSPVKAGGSGSIPELGKSPGEGNGSPLQYSCLQIPWTEEPGRLQSKRLQKSWTQLSD